MVSLVYILTDDINATKQRTAKEFGIALQYVINTCVVLFLSVIGANF